MAKNNSKKTLLLLIILFLPVGLIYYFVKRKEIKKCTEKNVLLNHPLITGFAIVILIIVLWSSFFPQEIKNADRSIPIPIKSYAQSHYVEIMNTGNQELTNFCAILNDRYKQCIGSLVPNELNYMEYIYFEDNPGEPIGKLIVPKKIKFTSDQGWVEHFYD